MIRQAPLVLLGKGMADPEWTKSGPKGRNSVGSASKHTEKLQTASQDARCVHEKRRVCWSRFTDPRVSPYA